MLDSMVELLRLLFLDIYRMSGTELIACCIVGTMGYHALHQKYGLKRRWRLGSVLMLALWAAAVICSTVLGRNSGQNGIFQVIPFHSYLQVLTGGSRDILRSNFMNIMLFFPAGLLFAGLLPQRWTFGKKLVCTIGGCFLFSLGIELAQSAFGLGLGETDDILHNTLGAILGFAAFSMADCIHPTK